MMMVLLHTATQIFEVRHRQPQLIYCPQQENYFVVFFLMYGLNFLHVRPNKIRSTLHRSITHTLTCLLQRRVSTKSSISQMFFFSFISTTQKAAGREGLLSSNRLKKMVEPRATYHVLFLTESEGAAGTSRQPPRALTL